eukprot:NODE_19029_length_863_cov_4.974185.p1 GENE.NODE_19029_length_863_cov_4.974185~~NODE_19029_length_863_cov_4.974185.p1  ORF type:complete len:163 (-),score=53.43 NODE_19029_length_863_cov_4.974185:238-726(-)
MISQQTPCCVVATSSVAGLVNLGLAGIGGGTPYTISKHAVTLTMEVLHAELRSKKGCQVKAHILCPGPVDTPYYARALNDAGFGRVNMPVPKIPVESVVALLEKGVLMNGDFYIKSEDPTYDVLLQARTDGIKKAKEPFAEIFNRQRRSVTATQPQRATAKL